MFWHRKIEQLNRASTPFDFNIDNKDMADISTLLFYNQFYAHLTQFSIGIKPFLELGPDVEDYYKPSSPNMSHDKRMQERNDYKGPIANKLLTLIKDTEYTTWFTTTPEIYSDGYEMLKQLIRHNIPALES